MLQELDCYGFNFRGRALKSHLESSRVDEKGVVNLRPSLTLSLEQVSYDLRFGGVPKMGRYSKKD